MLRLLALSVLPAAADVDLSLPDPDVSSSVECAGRLAGAGAAACARAVGVELRAPATANAACVAGVLPLVDAAGAAALAAGAVDVEVDAARWARIVGGGGDARGRRARPDDGRAAPGVGPARGRPPPRDVAAADAAPPALDVADVRVACAPRAVAVDAASAARNALALALDPTRPWRAALRARRRRPRRPHAREARRARWPWLERDSAAAQHVVGSAGGAATAGGPARRRRDADAAPRPPAARPPPPRGRPRRSRSARASPAIARRGSGAAGPSGRRAAAARLASRLRPVVFCTSYLATAGPRRSAPPPWSTADGDRRAHHYAPRRGSGRRCGGGDVAAIARATAAGSRSRRCASRPAPTTDGGRVAEAAPELAAEPPRALARHEAVRRPVVQPRRPPDVRVGEAEGAAAQRELVAEPAGALALRLDDARQEHLRAKEEG